MLSIPFNQDWGYRLHQGNMLFDPAARSAPLTPVTLPHDAMIHEKRVPEAESLTAKGYYPNRDYEYIKTFEAPQEWADKRVYLRFEGAYMNARVYVNGAFAGQCHQGYTEFTVCLSDYLRIGAKNTIKVITQGDTDSRWYSGAGLYREAALFVADSLHIAMNGVRLTTRSASSEVAAVEAEIRLMNEGLRAREIDVEIEFIDQTGASAGIDRQRISIPGQAEETISPRLYIKAPKLWSPDAPNTYEVSVRVFEGGALVDEYVEETFGMRVLELDNVRGLTVNGETVKLYGGCIHHDNGVIGAATIDAAEDRRVRLMKEAGYNAIRSAHHPMSRALLRACDRYGVLVMDELTDMWSTSKTLRDYSAYFADDWETAARAMVNKDYNHPSVVMYSMGNEIPDGGHAGARMYRKIAKLLKSEDATRYTTAGYNCMLAGGVLDSAFDGMEQHAQEPGEGSSINEMMSDAGAMMQKLTMMPAIVEATRECFEAMDICGYNYATDRYLHDSGLFTNWISVGSETFPKDLAYNWKIVRENGNVLGDFSWTSWDYLGEAGIGKDMYRKGGNGGFGDSPFPWRIAWDADFDITGRRTPQGYYREIVVGHRTAPYVAMQNPTTYDKEPFAASWSWPGTVSSWNWPGYEGKPIRVDVYGAGDEAELIVNGESLGRKPLPRETDGAALACLAVFETIYQPGCVEAIVYENGKETGRYAVQTADVAASLDVAVEDNRLTADDRGLAFVDVYLKDAAGRLNPGEQRSVKITVTGAGVLQGIGSGNPCTDEDLFDDHCETFYGHAFAVIRPTGAGEITVRVESEGLSTVTKTVSVKE